MTKNALVANATSKNHKVNRPYLLEQVGEAAVVQLYADGFTTLSLREKTLIYHLYCAALAGRDIYYDQRYVHNLEMREVLEQILIHANNVMVSILEEIRRYTKLFWINSGPYNNLTARKFVLNCTPEEFSIAVVAAGKAGANFPRREGETLKDMLARLESLFFDASVDPVVTNKTPGKGEDILSSSANNLYVDVKASDVQDFTEHYPLNSRLTKCSGRLVEEVYRIDGKYGKEITNIVRHLEAAIPFATDEMAQALTALITFYRTGTSLDREAYDIAWVQDDASSVDTINGFVEVYMDARGAKGAWEALVFYINEDKTSEIRTLAAAAQWFEDHMPWDAKYCKLGVQGITANAIDVVIESGDSGPITPIGINLPNDQIIREKHGSKSVLLSNVIEAHDRSMPKELRTEFAWTTEEISRAERWGSFVGELTTNMHEVIGHGSGKIADHLNGQPQAFLKEHYSALEESRADLVALYFVADPKLVDLGLVTVDDHNDIVLTEYEGYVRNALVQLRRVREGTQLEEDHMRNRQMIVHWLMENTTAVESRQRDGKTFYLMSDWQAFRNGIGQLLAEVQRIKSEGDYEAAVQLFNQHGIHFDPVLRDEVVTRVDALNLPSYTGFVQPRLEAMANSEGKITDVLISYPQDLTKQMLEYSGHANCDES